MSEYTSIHPQGALDDDLAGAMAAWDDTHAVTRNGRTYTRTVLPCVYEPTPNVIRPVRWSRAWAGRTDAGTIPA